MGSGGGGLEPVTPRAFAPSDGSPDEWQRCVMTLVLKRSLSDHHSLTAEKCCREGPEAQSPRAQQPLKLDLLPRLVLPSCRGASWSRGLGRSSRRPALSSLFPPYGTCAVVAGP